jgi:hypothetical protein
MKIIFLDFDGAINHNNFADLDRPETEEEKSFVDSLNLENTGHRARLAIRHLDPEAIAKLNIIIKSTGAKVVLSTAWRKFFTMSTLSAMLKHLGFEGEITDITPIRFSYVPREQEINSWIQHNSDLTYKFVIIDDLPTAGEYHPDNFVNTDPEVGLLTLVSTCSIISCMGL